MRIFNLRINSSVITFNLSAFIVIALTYLTSMVTENQDIINQIFTPTQSMAILGVVSVLTMWLRVSNLQGKKPVEVIQNPKTPPVGKS